MAGLDPPSIQTVTGKVQQSQSSVLANIFLEDTQVSHGQLVSDIKLWVSDDHIAQYRLRKKRELWEEFKKEYLQYGLGNLRARKFWTKMSYITSMKIKSLYWFETVL